MKKALPIILYPYLYMICLAVFFAVSFKSDTPTDSFFTFLLIMLILAIICNLYSFVLAFYYIRASIKGKYDAKYLSKLNLIIKTVQIPAYLIHFCLGIVGLLMSVWGFPILIWAILIDLVTISLSGLVAISTNISCRKENIFSSKQSILFSLLSFVYCIDVFVSIYLFIKVKKQ